MFSDLLQLHNSELMSSSVLRVAANLQYTHNMPTLTIIGPKQQISILEPSGLGFRLSGRNGLGLTVLLPAGTVQHPSHALPAPRATDGLLRIRLGPKWRMDESVDPPRHPKTYEP